MTILAAIRREERKLEKKWGQLQHRLNGMRTAAKALGHSAEREVVAAKKRVLSAAARAAIVKAAKKRWAKVRAKAKKVASQILGGFQSGVQGTQNPFLRLRRLPGLTRLLPISDEHAG